MKKVVFVIGLMFALVACNDAVKTDVVVVAKDSTKVDSCKVVVSTDTTVVKK